MNLSFDQLLQLVAAILGPVGAYYGAMQAIRVELARLEEKMIALTARVESDHDRLEDHLTQPHPHPQCTPNVWSSVGKRG